jgi:hypothetical protein
VTISHFPISLSIHQVVALRVGLAIAAYAVLIQTLRKGVVRPAEAKLLCGAIIFCAIGWLLPVLISVLRPRFGIGYQAVLIGVLLIAPVAASMVIGLVIVLRRYRS